MAKINTILGARTFEIIRNRIAEILTDEIENQGVLTGDLTFSSSKIFIEKNGYDDMQNAPLVNVSLMNGTFGERKSYDGKVKGVYLYSVDVYTSSKDTSVNDGDYLSSAECQKLIGLCFSILDNPIYRTLGYSPKGFIERVKTNDFNLRSNTKHDARNVSMGRLVFQVESEESVNLLDATVLDEFKTTLILEETNNGYVYRRII